MDIGSQIGKDNSDINNIENQNNYYFNKNKVLTFYEKDIKKIIIYFSKERNNIPFTSSEDADFNNKPLLEEKNRLNNLSKDYFEELQHEHMQYFYKIDSFLKDPKNKDYLKMYRKTTSELKYKIISLRKNYENFESILIELYDYVLNKNEEELGVDRDLIFVFLHFMYCNCDIGKKCKEVSINA